MRFVTLFFYLVLLVDYVDGSNNIRNPGFDIETILNDYTQLDENGMRYQQTGEGIDLILPFF
jgi:hypothetical protein